MSDVLTEGPDVFADTNNDGKRPGLLVILCGLATTVLALVIVYLMQSNGFQPMGFYMMLIIPIGAILVGIVAGSGYAIGSWWAGAKLGGGLLFLVIAIQLFAYFAAQYIEFNNYSKSMEAMKETVLAAMENENGAAMDEAAQEKAWQDIKKNSGANSFLGYFDMMTQTFAFQDKQGNPGNELGVWGYGLRVLEILGFCLGSLVGPAILMATPYCSECQIYKKTKQVGILPAGVAPRKVKKKDVEGQQAYQAEIETAIQGGMQLVQESRELGEAGNSMEFVELMNQMNEKESKKEIQKQTSRIIVNMIYCPRCNDGVLSYQMQTGFGEDMTTNPVGEYAVDNNFIREVNMSI